MRAISGALLGKILVTHFDGIITSGRMVETKGYIGLTDIPMEASGGTQ